MPEPDSAELQSLCALEVSSPWLSDSWSYQPHREKGNKQVNTQECLTHNETGVSWSLVVSTQPRGPWAPWVLESQSTVQSTQSQEAKRLLENLPVSCEQGGLAPGLSLSSDGAAHLLVIATTHRGQAPKDVLCPPEAEVTQPDKGCPGSKP